MKMVLFEVYQKLQGHAYQKKLKGYDSEYFLRYQMKKTFKIMYFNHFLV